jgi:hypothetical protein
MRIDDQQRFCARWLEQRGIYEHPTLQQLMEMAEAWAAYRLRLKSCGAFATGGDAAQGTRTGEPPGEAGASPGKDAPLPPPIP